MENKRFSSFDLFIFLLQWKWVIVGCSIVCGALGFGIVNLMEREYKSGAVLRVAGESGSSLMSSLAGDLPIGGLLEGNLPGNSSVQAFLEVMYSHEVLVPFIRKHQLLSLYKKKKIELLLPLLVADLQCVDVKNGIIKCSYVTKDPDSVKIFLADFLDFSIHRYETLQRQMAKEKTEFLRIREQGLKDSLQSAEKLLLEFSIRNGVLDAAEQSKLSLGMISEMEASKGILELQLKLARSRVGKDASNSLQMQEETELIENELKRRRKDTATGTSLAIPLKKIPKFVLEERRLRLNIEGFRFLYQLASKERIIEEGKVQGGVSPVQLIEAPFVPDWKSGPKRAKGMIIGAALGLFIAVISMIFTGIIRKTLPVEKDVLDRLRLIKTLLFGRG